MRLTASNYRLLPVYNVLQDQHRHVCGDPCEAFIKVYDTAFPPFQLIFDEDMGIPSSVRLKSVCSEGTYVTNWSNAVTRIEKDIDQDEVNEWVYTFAGGAFMGVPAGSYYVEIVFPGDVKMYTEVFAHPGACTNCKEYWYLEYSHSCAEKSLGDYSMGFVNKLYLGDIILFRDGSIENVISRKDGFGLETNIASDIRPKWTFDIMGNWWLLDSLEFLKLYDTVLLKRSGNDDVFELKNISVVPDGETKDCDFPIKISFTKDYLVNTKCCDSIYEQAPLPANCSGMHVMTSENFQICSGDSAELVATIIGGAQPIIFIWSTGDTGDTITVSPTETTTYIVTAIDAFGCVKQDEVTITVIECTGEFDVAIEASDNPVCEGASVDLDATVTGGTGPFTYLWSTGATTEDITVTPDATTVYSLQVTDTFDSSVVMADITVTVLPNPTPTIQNNQCFLSLAQVQACEEVSYEWQIETDPDVWEAAEEPNNGTTYNGENGNNYRLKVTCDGCVGYSNEIEVECPQPCTTEITDVSYDDGENELSITIATTLGTNSFITGYIEVYEALDPGPPDCSEATNWLQVIIYTLPSESGTFVIPFTPENLPTCMLIGVNINANECHDEGVFPISA